MKNWKVMTCSALNVHIGYESCKTYNVDYYAHGIIPWNIKL